MARPEVHWALTEMGDKARTKQNCVCVCVGARLIFFTNAMDIW